MAMSPISELPDALGPSSRNSEYLESLIREAIESISKATLEPPLTTSDFDPQLFERINPVALPPSDFYKSSLEHAHKNILYGIATKGDPASNDAVTVAFGKLLDFALISTENGIADASLPFTLMEELFDTQTIPASERLFQYMESRVERITAGMEGGKGKALVLLRLCNELLRRLSKAEDTIFCGRILIFLSKSFPIAERSAVNLRGEFNVENVTIYDDVSPEIPSKEEMDIDEPQKQEESDSKGDDDSKAKSVTFKEKSAEKKTVDSMHLYCRFWSLQHDFADPTRLFVSENFDRFKEGLIATMDKFREADEEALRTSGGSGPGKGESGANGSKKPDEKKPVPVGGSKRKREDEECEDEFKGESFNPKYLTSRELFELEISDLTFRRHVLVQAMILLDFLLGLSPSAKEKWTGLEQPNRSVQWPFTLSPEQEQWAIKTKSQITSSLQPDTLGRLFMRLINTVLTREQNWVQWKLEGCHPFDMPPLEKQEFVDARDKALGHCKPERPFPYVMGTPQLSKLWQDTGKDVLLENLDNFKSTVPAYDARNIAEGELKDALSDETKQTKTWKGLRRRLVSSV